MECVVFLMVLLLVGLATARAANPASRRRVEDRIWRQLAVNLGGVFTGGGVLARPTIHFRYATAKATLQRPQRLHSNRIHLAPT